MATKPLQTIKFPGLDDTYTVPQVDSTLQVAGAAADAKKTGDEIGELNERLEDLDERVEALEAGGAGSGLTEDIKAALLQLASKVAYIDEHGQDYYDDLEAALYPPAELVSIDAVYTQSRTVYNTDALDVLKSDLTVTAHMSDRTMRTVTEYVLLGTLAVGTSTITVAYGGKTATFDVVVTDLDSLPSGYTRYDFLEFSGNANDSADYIIDTGVNSTYCDIEYIHEIILTVYNPSNTGVNNGIYGCRNATGSAGAKNGNCLWVKGQNKDKIAVGYNGVDSGYSLPFTFSEKHTVRLDSGKVYIDDAHVSTPSGARTSYNTSSIRLFGVATNEESYSTAHTAMRVYGLTITDSRNGSVIAKFIPCTNPSNIPGVYDTVGGIFRYAADYSAYTCANDEV